MRVSRTGSAGHNSVISLATVIQQSVVYNCPDGFGSEGAAVMDQFIITDPGTSNNFNSLCHSLFTGSLDRSNGLDLGFSLIFPQPCNRALNACDIETLSLQAFTKEQRKVPGHCNGAAPFFFKQPGQHFAVGHTTVLVPLQFIHEFVIGGGPDIVYPGFLFCPAFFHT